tara:strand:+ start:33990 stop:36473 length:2484 start_codon:yes stop_codon:yes gene_type:complete
MAKEKKKSLSVSSTRTYPDPLASSEEKNTDAYGLQMAKLIENEWFYKKGNSQSSYYDKRLIFDKRRRYARGEHDVDLSKKLITDGTDGDSYTNYDWRPIQILPKFIKIIVNKMLERLFEVDAQAIDGISQGLRDSYKEILEKNMVSRGMLEDAKNLLGVDLVEDEGSEALETPEEIDLHMRLKYKPSIEIAIEEALKYTLELNEYDEIQKKLLKDLTEIGVSAMHHTTDPTKGIVVEYRDPADMVWSYPTQSNFGNVYYYGYVKRMTINELQRISGKKLDEDELQKLKNVSNEWQSYNNISDQFWYRGEDLANWMVDVLFFTYKTTKITKYKKKYRKNGSFGITEKGHDFQKTDETLLKEKEQGYKDYDILENVDDIWYEGSLVLGTQKLFGYRECSEMVRPEGFINNKVSSNYVVYAPELYQGRIQALTDRVIQTIDQLQQISIKIQQFIAKCRPNGLWIDVDGLNELDLGGGNTFDVLETIRYYDETGNLLGTSRLNDGSYNNGGLPIKELNNGSIAGLEQLMNSYNFHFNLFRDFIGVAEGADATLPDARTAVGVQQSVNKGSDIATRYILDSQLKMTQYLANGLSLRLKTVLNHPNLKKAYINSIGKVNVDVLESIKKLHLHDFGITIKLRPDAQDRAMLEQNIQAEIVAGNLAVTDGIDIRKIGNISVANEYLKIRKDKHVKEAHKRQLELVETQTQGNIQTTQASTQAKIAEEDAKNKGKTSLELLKRETERLKFEWELQAKKELMDKEYFLQTGIELAKDKNEKAKAKESENRKDKRTAIQATQQSAMKAAKEAGKTAPIDFNSSHASMTGGLGEEDFNV